MSGDDANGPTYETGYGRPPKEGRFKPGQSGNPKGRPRKPQVSQGGPSLRPVRDLMIDELFREVTLTHKGRRVKMPAVQAVIRSTIASAGSGNRQASRALLKLAVMLEKQAADERMAVFGAALNQKQNLEERRRFLLAQGLPDAEVSPHPDDVVLDWITLSAKYVGPLTAEHSKALEDIIALRDRTEIDFKLLLTVREKDWPSSAVEHPALWAQRIFDSCNDKLPSRYQKALKGRLPDPGDARLTK